MSVELALLYTARPSLCCDHLFGTPVKKKTTRGSDPPETGVASEAGVGDINAETNATIQGLVERLKGHSVFKSIFKKR